MTRHPHGLSLTTTTEASATVLTLTGAIDESAQLVPLVAKLIHPVTVDLDGVEFINSIGVREWVRFMRALTAKGSVKLRRCSEAMVLQFNMVSDSVEKAYVESFYAPYLCERCNLEESRLLESGKDYTKGTVHQLLPELTCNECGGLSQFAESADRYLVFLE